jgi:transposase-like protein
MGHRLGGVVHRMAISYETVRRWVNHFAPIIAAVTISRRSEVEA